MFLRFLKWLMVALIAAAIVLALEQALQSGASAATLGVGGRDFHSPEVPSACQEALGSMRGDYQNAVMAATPCAPAFHACSSTASVMPPMA